MEAANLIGDIADNASQHVQQHYRALWRLFLRSIENSSPHMLIPKSLADQIGEKALVDLMSRFSVLVHDDIYLHLDKDNDAYLVGPILNLPSGPRIGASKHVVYYGSAPNEFPKIQSGSHSSTQGLGAVSQEVPNPTAAQKEDKIRKPPNAWILYRNHHQGGMKCADMSMKLGELSKAIAVKWRNETPDVKAQFHRLAEVEKQNHQLQHPNWKCSPRKTAGKKAKLTVLSNVASPDSGIDSGFDSGSYNGSASNFNETLGVAAQEQYSGNWMPAVEQAEFNFNPNVGAEAQEQYSGVWMHAAGQAEVPVSEQSGQLNPFQQESWNAHARDLQTPDADAFDTGFASQRLHLSEDGAGHTGDVNRDRDDLNSLSYAPNQHRNTLEYNYQ